MTTLTQKKFKLRVLLQEEVLPFFRRHFFQALSQVLPLIPRHAPPFLPESVPLVGW